VSIIVGAVIGLAISAPIVFAAEVQERVGDTVAKLNPFGKGKVKDAAKKAVKAVTAPNRWARKSGEKIGLKARKSVKKGFKTGKRRVKKSGAVARRLGGKIKVRAGKNKRRAKAAFSRKNFLVSRAQKRLTKAKAKGRRTRQKVPKKAARQFSQTDQAKQARARVARIVAARRRQRLKVR